MSTSFVSVVDRCDNFRVETSSEPFAKFRLTPSSAHIIGLIRQDVLVALEQANQAAHSSGQPPLWDIHKGSEPEPVSSTVVAFSSWADTPEARTTALKTLTEGWRDSGLFADIISPRLWRDELYPVYVNTFSPHTVDTVAFAMERTACALFGVITYGVHMTMHTVDWRIWVPTRANTKQTWPLCLDNSVAGGIPHGLPPFEALVKECAEEANLDETLVRKHAKSRGCVSYFFKSPKGYLQPEVQFVYDLLVPAGEEAEIVPRPLDGEVESFELEDLRAVAEKMHEGLFKPNCALVLIDFFVRHGIITPENDPYYLDIITRLHGRFGYEP